MKRSIIIITIAAMMTICNSCIPKYTLNGAAIDYSKYRTISISDFPIRAALVYPENKLKDMVSQQTRLQVVDSPNSDLRMEGEISGYSLSPQAVREDAYASQTRLTIQVKIHYIDAKNPALTSEQTFSAYRDFNSDQMLTDVQDDLCNQICNDLTDLIFNATLGNW